MGSSGVGSGNLHSVFVYGSLLADDVVRVLLKRVPESSSAVLNNYHRFSIKDRIYPAILPVLSKTVTGKVLLGITDPELHILDVFEDVEYQRTTVDVSLMDNADKLQAQAYVWSDKNDPNLYGDWDFQEWQGVYMKDFLKMTASFVEELDMNPSTRRMLIIDNTTPTS
ncbi:hypothetical protein LWI29_001778 [Acer saccharum]|uniref:Putative gamma-glutamylcyclotransferase n=1 Tax=Acer saccharum TaxID=4024 RepID=A0AA39RBF5_ACESA|nr:hypothetical protein LWI29_001778 [Acer saccharum]